MSRELRIDEDTLVGYSYQEETFYIENKQTYTRRATASAAKRVLDIVAPDNTYQEVNIDALRTDWELITSLSCTLEDSGAFVKTVTLNDYDYYPLVIDCPLHKLYIMNTDKVYDLTLNTNPQEYILKDLISFYHLTLGFNETSLNNILPSLYYFLLDQYDNTDFKGIYNEITKREDTSTPLYYNNKVCLKDYKETPDLEYTLTVNPKNEVSLDKLGDVIGMNQDTKTITILPSTAFTDFPQTEDKKVYVSGLSITVGSDTYTGNGTYTYVSKDTTKGTIVVEENLPFDYSFPYPKVYLMNPSTTITVVSNPDSTITVSNVAGFNVGQTVTIYGSADYVNDGEYNILAINGNTITLDTVPPKSMTTNCGRVTVMTYIGEVLSTSGNNITFRETPLVTPETNNWLAFNDAKSYRQVVSISGKTVTLNSSMPVPIPSYPTMSYNKQATTVGISITSSSLEELPEGEFYVDNNEQCREYIGLGNKGECVPPVSTLEKVNKKAVESYIIGGVTCSVKGLYSEFYS